MKGDDSFLFDEGETMDAAAPASNASDGGSDDETIGSVFEAATEIVDFDKAEPSTANATDDMQDDADDAASSDGETRGMETRAGSMEEILALKRDYERKVKAR